jgi:DNA-directed RNA polymerase subunit L
MAESNNDMKKIIKKKLIKAYHQVHPQFATSKLFLKLLTDTTLAINQDPKRVYSRLNEIILELKSRINFQYTPEEPISEENKEEFQGTGDEKTDNLLKKLNKGLRSLKKRIEDLETAEVDLDDDYDSAYMQKVRLEQRAVEVCMLFINIVNRF